MRAWVGKGPRVVEPPATTARTRAPASRRSDTVTNRTGEAHVLFIDHRAADPRAKNPYALVVGRELLDSRFLSPIVYRLNVSIGPDRAPAVAVLVESRDEYETVPSALPVRGQHGSLSLSLTPIRFKR